MIIYAWQTSGINTLSNIVSFKNVLKMYNNCSCDKVSCNELSAIPCSYIQYEENLLCIYHIFDPSLYLHWS